MNFSTVSKVQQTIRAGDTVEWERGENRVKINNAANCVPPLSPQIAKKLGIKINVNWGELMILLAHARRQYLSAFWSNSHFFKVSLPYAPSEKQSIWEAFITDEINKVLRNSLGFFELHRSKWAAVVAHGQGPMMWHEHDGWEPEYVAIEDLRIPTDTKLGFKNLGWFAARFTYTPFELVDRAFYGNDKRWNKKGVAQILKAYKEINYDYAPNHYDWETTPEKMAELVKQDGGYYASDAMPGIPLWHFYYRDHTQGGTPAWFKRVVPEQGTVRGSPVDQFLWDSEGSYADRWENILHCQYGDLNNKSPFLYHSVRSLGFALLEPTFYTNLTRCRMLQHLHDNFNIWLKINDPSQKGRAAVQEFGDMAVLKTGVNVVPREERHQVDPELIDMAMGQLKQLQSEASSSYTQQPDTGTQKEQTAFETSVKIQQVNALMGGLLLTAFTYENHAYKEIGRRFCNEKSSDPDVKIFWQRCKQAGVPARYLDIAMWDVQPVTPLGMGNPTLAEAKSRQLMEMRPAYDATAQQEILHEATIVVTGDPRKAARWVPLGTGRGMTDSQRDAMSIFGTLMQGVPLPPREGLSAQEQAMTMLGLLAGVVHRYQQRDNMATPDEAQGLQTVVQYIEGRIAELAQDQQNKAIVKELQDDLAQLTNEVKALAQRGAEAAQAKNEQSQQDPKAVAAARATMVTAQAKIKAKALADKQKLKQSDEKFAREQRRKDAETHHNLQRKGLEAQADAAAKQLKTFKSGNGDQS